MVDCWLSLAQANRWEEEQRVIADRRATIRSEYYQVGQTTTHEHGYQKNHLWNIVNQRSKRDKASSFLRLSDINCSRTVMMPWRDSISSSWVKFKNEKSFMSVSLLSTRFHVSCLSPSMQVTVHCCLHEKTYNPYYTLILQRFCAYDRRFQVRFVHAVVADFNENSLDLSAISHLGSIQRSVATQRSAIVELGLGTRSITDVQITQLEYLQGTSLDDTKRV